MRCLNRTLHSINDSGNSYDCSGSSEFRTTVSDGLEDRLGRRTIRQTGRTFTEMGAYDPRKAAHAPIGRNAVMITVGMNYQIIPGKDEDFTKVFSKVLQIMEGMDGHQETHLYRDVYSEHDYLIVSEWSDEDAFKEFMSSDQFRNVADWGSMNVLRGRPTHEIFGAENAPKATASQGQCPVHHE